MGSASDAHIASYAQNNALCVLTGDADFSDLRVYPPDRHHGLVVLHVPPHATAASILALLEDFLKQPHVVRSVVGKLAIVESGRVRLRQALK